MVEDDPSPETPRDPAAPPMLGYATASRPSAKGDAQPDASREGDVYRQGQTLIAIDGAVLPPRCILCGGAAAGAPLRLAFSWDASFHVTHESTLQIGRKATVQARLCAGHRRRWQSGRSVGITGIALSTAAVVAGIAITGISENAQVPLYAAQGIWIVIAGFAVMILFLFWFAICTRTLSCERIVDGYLYLTGAAPEFLAVLPELIPHDSGRDG